MDDHGDILAIRQHELLPEPVALFLLLLLILLPMVIQPDLPDRDDLFRPFLSVQPVHGRFVQLPDLVRVDPDGGVDIRIFLRQRDRRAGGGEARPHVHDPADPQPWQGSQQLLPVRIECLVVVMGVGLKNHGNFPPL